MTVVIHSPEISSVASTVPDTRPTAIDLFSGCGGMTQGLKDAGFRVLAAIDISTLATETYMANHPEVTVWEGDIRQITTDELMDRLDMTEGELDLLAGCPPCQGYSSIRTLNGALEIEDNRNDLVFDFLRFVEGFRPKVIMMENVPELATDRRMEAMLDQLIELGYIVEADYALRILNAGDYGVAQRRRRMILLASLYGAVPFAAPDPNPRYVHHEIRNLPPAGTSGDRLHDYPERRSERIMALIDAVPRDGGSRTDLPKEYQLECHKKCDGFKDVYGRMAWNRVAPTLTGGCTNPSKGRFLHPEENRAITLREAALLQSFPRNYHFSLRRGKGGAAEMIGNALPPRFIERHARRIRDYLRDYHQEGGIDGVQH